VIRFLSRVIEHLRLGEPELSGGELSAPPEATPDTLAVHARIPGMFTEDYCAHDHETYPCATVRRLS
jgi:hypothetical protein